MIWYSFIRYDNVNCVVNKVACWNADSEIWKFGTHINHVIKNNRCINNTIKIRKNVKQFIQNISKTKQIWIYLYKTRVLAMIEWIQETKVFLNRHKFLFSAKNLELLGKMNETILFVIMKNAIVPRMHAEHSAIEKLAFRFELIA